MFPDTVIYFLFPIHKIVLKYQSFDLSSITWNVTEAKTLGSVNLVGGLLAVMVMVWNKEITTDEDQC